MNNENKTYLGDGVYAEFVDYAVILATGTHASEENIIYLELDMVKSLSEFLDRQLKMIKEKRCES